MMIREKLRRRVRHAAIGGISANRKTEQEIRDKKEETITDERKPGTAAQATKCPARQ